MREKIRQQLLIRPAPLRHKRWRELTDIRERLDKHPEAATWVFEDLVAAGADPRLGRTGMSAEEVLACLALQARLKLSFDMFEFELAANDVYRDFCRVAPSQTWSRATLHRNLSMVRPETVERINRLLVVDAEEEGLEDRSRVRFDATAVESNIHAPLDSAQLSDVCRVLTRLMTEARIIDATIEIVDHTPEAKRLNWRISCARGKEHKLPHYVRLMEITEATIGGAQPAAESLRQVKDRALRDLAEDTAERLLHFAALGERVMSQTRRRVVNGESVPANEKVLSIFEPHADLVVKGQTTICGHKIALASGRSGLLLDCQIYRGNPNDKTLALPLMERQRTLFGSVPSQAAFDGGFASAENLKALKAGGTKDVVFSKAPGIPRRDMARSDAVFKNLRNFRAGIEGDIAYLKNGFGLRRCLRRGWEGFKAYVWTRVLSANLFTLARRRHEREQAAPT